MFSGYCPVMNYYYTTNHLNTIPGLHSLPFRSRSSRMSEELHGEPVGVDEDYGDGHGEGDEETVEFVGGEEMEEEVGLGDVH